MRKRFAFAGAAAMLGALALAATVAATGPGQGQVAADALKLTREQVMELRHDGLSLAQIAEKQGVPVSTLVDAVTTRLVDRIQVRVENGALTEEQATPLREQVRERAEAMVQQAEMGGMQGAAVGAGPANGRGAGAGTGTGTGTGECDGTGPHGAGRS